MYINHVTTVTTIKCRENKSDFRSQSVTMGINSFFLRLHIKRQGITRQTDRPIDTCRQWQTDRQIERWTDRHSRAVSVYVLLWLTDIFIYRQVDSISFIHINPKINPVNVSMG